MTRRKLDAYYTPEWATEALLAHTRIRGLVLEPCSGDNAIAQYFPDCVTNDIDPNAPSTYHDDAVRFMTRAMDATAPQYPYDWIASNPPFNEAPRIVQRAYKTARRGIAMLLRLSFLEPCEDRSDFLVQHPPHLLLVLPRISFTGDGHTDSVTCAWHVWYKDVSRIGQSGGIIVVPKDDV